MTIKKTLRHTASTFGLAGLILLTGNGCSINTEEESIDIHQITGLTKKDCERNAIELISSLDEIKGLGEGFSHLKNSDILRFPENEKDLYDVKSLLNHIERKEAVLLPVDKKGPKALILRSTLESLIKFTKETSKSAALNPPTFLLSRPNHGTNYAGMEVYTDGSSQVHLDLKTMAGKSLYKLIGSNSHEIFHLHDKNANGTTLQYTDNIQQNHKQEHYADSVSMVYIGQTETYLARISFFVDVICENDPNDPAKRTHPKNVSRIHQHMRLMARNPEMEASKDIILERLIEETERLKSSSNLHIDLVKDYKDILRKESMKTKYSIHSPSKKRARPSPTSFLSNLDINRRNSNAQGWRAQSPPPTNHKGRT